ncbi:hypothetical protein ACFOGJ_17985 [Marinibaculum pumilum]|uniref:O-GlcNAc transferase C-terminal domain-containing protein n=1 Tax=Marinibaculum pumilum TaxID=1766165 RepID=A0ABV7L4F5_9PROT
MGDGEGRGSQDPAAPHPADLVRDPGAAHEQALQRLSEGRLAEAESLFRGLREVLGPAGRLVVEQNLAVLEWRRGNFAASWRWVRSVMTRRPRQGADLARRLAFHAQLFGVHDIFWTALAASRSLAPEDLRAWSMAHVAADFRGAPAEHRTLKALPDSLRQPRHRKPRSGPAPRRIALVISDLGSFSRMFQPFVRLRQLGFDLSWIHLVEQDGGGEGNLPEGEALSVPGRDAQAQVAAIEASDPDVVIDLASHSQPDVLAAYCQCDSPLLLGWAGNAVTSGTGFFDGWLTDASLCPPGAERHYAEPVIRLPVTSVTVEPIGEYPQAGVLPLDRNGHVTFGSFHRICKISTEALDLWAELLRAQADARLLMKAPFLDDMAAASRIRDAFKERGIPSWRIDLRGGSDQDAHRAAMQAVDVALGGFPEQGLVTDFECFMLGVPTVSLRVDDRPCACLSDLLSRAAGAPFLVTRRPRDYLERALGLAGDAGYLRQARQCYRENILSSGITDHTATASAMGEAIRQLWSGAAGG